MPDKKARDALQRDYQTLWHPCTPLEDQKNYPPLVIERGEGVYLIDREGRRYMDVISSWWVNIFGHNHPRLNAALKRQLEKVAHVMFAGITHEPAIQLAETLVNVSPENLTRVFFSDNGSTSVEIALKMSLQFWQQTGRPEKTRFVYLKGGYHGETLGALSTCGMDLFRGPFDPVLMNNLEAEGPDCLRCPFGLQRESCNAECFESMERTLRENHGQISAVIVEPLVQGAAGMKMYPPVYLHRLQSLCEELDVLTLYDEVAVAFGRTGALMVCQEQGLRPTFVCLSKGITSGYLPLAATLAEERIYKAFEGDFKSRKWFVHSHSYTANPLACAVANESLAMFHEDGFWETLESKIKLMAECGKWFEALPWCGEFRQTGMIAALELVRDRETLTEFPAEERIGYQIYQEGLKRGVFMRPLGNVIYFMPPLVVTEEQIREMFDIAYACIQNVLGNIE